MNCKSRQKLCVLVIAHSFVIMFYSVKPDLSHTSGVNWCLFALYPSYFGTAKAYSNTFWGFFLTLAGKSKVFFLHAHPNCQVSVNLNSGIYLCSPLFNRQRWKISLSLVLGNCREPMSHYKLPKVCDSCINRDTRVKVHLRLVSFLLIVANKNPLKQSWR